MQHVGLGTPLMYRWIRQTIAWIRFLCERSKSIRNFQTLPAGWKQTAAICEDTQTGAQFDYCNSGNYFAIATIVAGDTMLPAQLQTVFRKLAEKRLVAYLTVNTNTINGDGTFNYTVITTHLSNRLSDNFNVDTITGYGSHYLEWNTFVDRS